MKTVIAASVATLTVPCLSLAEEGLTNPQVPIRHEAQLVIDSRLSPVSKGRKQRKA
jgi:hypothetical protein